MFHSALCRCCFWEATFPWVIIEVLLLIYNDTVEIKVKTCSQGSLQTKHTNSIPYQNLQSFFRLLGFQQKHRRFVSLCGQFVQKLSRFLSST